jgi:hypothetical protein
VTKLNRIALVLVIIGALNWLLVGVANYNAVAVLLGANSTASKVIYVLIGIAGLWEINILVGNKKSNWWKRLG